MAYLLSRPRFYFRVGENPEESMRSMLERIGTRVIHTRMIPLSLSGGMRLEIFIDKLDKNPEDIIASLDNHTGYLCVPTTVWVGDPDDGAPPSPIPPKTIPKVTNQVMLNAFRAMALELGLDFWGAVVKCNLQGMAIPTENRGMMYSGPALEDLPLTSTELASLKRHLGL